MTDFPSWLSFFNENHFQQEQPRFFWGGSKSPAAITAGSENRKGECNMKIDILYDNSSSRNDIQSGWGFSCLIDERILFDTGEEPVSLLQNFEKMEREVSRIEAIVISHEHWDHIGGSQGVLKKRRGIPVYVCPGFSDGFINEIKISGGKPVTAGDPLALGNDFFLTGEIPSVYKGIPMPEQALVINRPEGLVVITGCSHPGIVTMVEKAGQACPGKGIHIVLGGFHLMNSGEEEVRGIADNLKARGVEKVAPTHCTGEDAEKIFAEIYGDDFIAVAAGTTIDV